MNKKNLLVGQDRRKPQERGNFDKEQAIEETLIMMRILWNKAGYEKFKDYRIDLRLDKEKYILRNKDDFKNIIRVFDLVQKMKHKPNVRFVLKPR